MQVALVSCYCALLPLANLHPFMPSHFWFNAVWLALHWNAATCEMVGSVLTVNSQSLCACCLDLYFVVCFLLFKSLCNLNLKKNQQRAICFKEKLDIINCL